MYGYEIWFEGNCLTESIAFDMEYETEEEALADAEADRDDIFISDEYSKDGYDIDDFDIIIKEL